MLYNGDLTPLLKSIEHIKIDHDIKNTDIATSMGKSKQTVSNLLNGRQGNITLETLLNLCNAINCDLEINIVPRK